MTAAATASGSSRVRRRDRRHGVDVAGEHPADVLGESDEQGQPGAQVGRAGALGQPGPGVDGPVREAAQPGLGDDVDGRLEQLRPAATTGAGRRHVTHCVAPDPCRAQAPPKGAVG